MLPRKNSIRLHFFPCTEWAVGGNQIKQTKPSQSTGIFLSLEEPTVCSNLQRRRRGCQSLYRVSVFACGWSTIHHSNPKPFPSPRASSGMELAGHAPHQTVPAQPWHFPRFLWHNWGQDLVEAGLNGRWMYEGLRGDAASQSRHSWLLGWCYYMTTQGIPAVMTVCTIISTLVTVTHVSISAG